MSQGREPRAKDPRTNDSLRTLRLDEGAALRDQLSQALREERRPVLGVMSGDETGARQRLDGTTVIG